MFTQIILNLKERRSLSRAISGFNLYTPSQIAELCSQVKNVSSAHIQSKDVDKHFRVGWGAKLDKYFKKLPGGYTFSFFFEFTNGWVTYRRLATSPDEEAITHKMIDITSETRETIWKDFLGDASVNNLCMRNLTLACNPGKKPCIFM